MHDRDESRVILLLIETPEGILSGPLHGRKHLLAQRVSKRRAQSVTQETRGCKFFLTAEHVDTESGTCPSTPVDSGEYGNWSPVRGKWELRSLELRMSMKDLCPPRDTG